MVEQTEEIINNNNNNNNTTNINNTTEPETTINTINTTTTTTTTTTNLEQPQPLLKNVYKCKKCRKTIFNDLDIDTEHVFLPKQQYSHKRYKKVSRNYN